MRIIPCSELFQKKFKGSVITIGNFDGVHRGHLEIFHHLRSCAERLELPSVVVTFEPHPLAVLAPHAAPRRITTFEQKSALIAAAGIDCLVLIRFTKEFSLFSADSFVRDILCHSLGMRHIIIGHDYAFGRNRQGNFATLARLGVECGFTLEDIQPVGEGDVVFSSSLARRMIADGDLPGAASVLGRFHTISGHVVHGHELGSKLGFPTANIVPDNDLILPDGVYAVLVTVGDGLYQGACSIGSNPTFEGRKRSVETFLLDYDGQLYDRKLSVSFVRRLRDMRKFPDSATLVKAIEEDVAMTRKILAEADHRLVHPFQPIENR